MTLNEAINEVNNLKPNMYGLPEKIKWLSRLDTRIFQTILLTHELSEEEKARFLPEEEEEETDDTSLAEWALDLRRRYPEKEEELVFEGYTEADIDTQLLVGEPYDELYTLWLSAQIDWNNMEYESFNNSNAMFESVYNTFRNAFNNTHKPKGNRKIYF